MNALQIIQQKLKAPKSQHNKFGNYNFRNQEDILEAVKPLLAETNSVLVVSDELVELGGFLFVKSTATLTAGFDDVSIGVIWSASAFAKHATEQKGMQDAQITGSASSYARKYALNGLFLIDDTRDSDSLNDGKDNKQPKSKPEAKPTPPTSTDTPKPSPELKVGTKNYEHTVKRMKEGVTLDVIKKHFTITEEVEKQLNIDAKA